MNKGSPLRAPSGTPASPPRAKRVIVVIPTYNEAANLPKLLDGIMATPTLQPLFPEPRRRSGGVDEVLDLEVLFVDDNSPDGTADEVEGLSPRFLGRVSVLRKPSKEGLGPAYQAGFAEALARGADYVVEMDADLSHSPEYLPDMLSCMADYDVAVGSRWTRGGGTEEEWGLGRKLLSRGGALYSRLLLGLRVKDPTTGFKCFRAEALRGLRLENIRSHGFGFQVEMAFACQRRGYRIIEVPILFRSRHRGRSKMSLGIIVEALWRVLAIRFGGSKV